MLKSTSFTFDGVPSETYGVGIYFLDDSSERELSLGTDVDMIEDRLPKRTAPIHYGVDVNKSMSFPLTFGSTEYLTDDDIDVILSWLTGHQQYKWLEFLDGDHYVRYKCHLNNMQAVHINGLPVAFTCDVECDGQFAYEYPATTIYEVDDVALNTEFYNKSSYNGYLYPKLKLEFDDDCNTLSITNKSDNNREFKIDYFDREIHEANNSIYTYTTSLANEMSENAVEDFITWNKKQFSIKDSYREIIANESIMVAFPLSGDVAIYSEDNGETWNQTTLPYSGSWTGCYGDKGFVAICTDKDSNKTMYSSDGKVWKPGNNLSVAQTWTKVLYVQTQGLVTGYYLAMANNSAIISRSNNGVSWSQDNLPCALDWVDIINGNYITVLLAKNTNRAVVTTNCVAWTEVELPVASSWVAGCHNGNDFYIISDSNQGVGLKSEDGVIWDEFEFPIGAWLSMIHTNNGMLAVGDRRFTHSLNGTDWTTSNMPSAVTEMFDVNGQYLCTMDNDIYLVSSSGQSATGTFSVPIPNTISGAKIDNMYASVKIYNIVDDMTFFAKEEPVVMATMKTEDGELVMTGNEYRAITTDLRYGYSVDGVMMLGVIDPDDNTVTFTYTVENASNNQAVLATTMDVILEYDLITTTDLEYQGLIVEFDNNNQIITTNKETLNMYQYFNRKFLRFVKGANKLSIKTDGGKCKITMSYEFLRKAGGR